jgi:transposase
MQKEQRTFTREFQVEAVQLVQSSKKSQAQIARDLGSADSTLHHCCKQFSEQGEQAFPGSGHQLPQEEEIRQLKRENDLLRQERDILKKAIGIVSRNPTDFVFPIARSRGVHVFTPCSKHADSTARASECYD